MKTFPSPLAIALCCFAFLAPTRAQVPQFINYQGRLAVGAVNFEGAGQFRFALVDGTGATTYWRNAPDTTPADGVPDSAVSLTVTKGLYSVLLGDPAIANMAAIPPGVFNNADVRLRVWFDDSVNGNQHLAPDQRIAAVGYALMADGVKDGAITSAKIAAGAVGSTQLAAGAVTSTKLAANAVQSGNIAVGAVGSTQLAAGAVTSTQLAANAVAGTLWTGNKFVTLGDSISSGGLSWTEQLATAMGATAVNRANAGWTTQMMLHGIAFLASASGNPATITTETPHLLTTGDTITIVGTATTPASIDDDYTVTVTGASTFTIPVNVTGGSVATSYLIRHTGNHYYLAEVQPHAPVFPARGPFAVLGGVNDLYNTTAEVIYARLKTIWALARADGFHPVIACTLPDSNFLPPVYDQAAAQRQLIILNRLILSDPALYDALLRFDLLLPDATDLTYFLEDELHPTTTAGRALMSGYASGRLHQLQTHAYQLGSDQLGAAVQRQFASIYSTEIDAVQRFVPEQMKEWTTGSSVTGTFRNEEGGYELLVSSGAPATSSIGLHARLLAAMLSWSGITWDQFGTNSIGFWTKLRVSGSGDSFTRFVVGNQGGAGAYNTQLDDNGVGWEIRLNGANYEIRLLTYDSSLHTGAWVALPANTTLTVALFVKDGDVNLWVRALLSSVVQPWQLMATAATGPTTVGETQNRVRLSAHAPDGGAASADWVTYFIDGWVSRGVDAPLEKLPLN